MLCGIECRISVTICQSDRAVEAYEELKVSGMRFQIRSMFKISVTGKVKHWSLGQFLHIDEYIRDSVNAPCTYYHCNQYHAKQPKVTDACLSLMIDICGRSI